MSINASVPSPWPRNSRAEGDAAHGRQSGPSIIPEYCVPRDHISAAVTVTVVVMVMTFAVFVVAVFVIFQ